MRQKVAMLTCNRVAQPLLGSVLNDCTFLWCAGMRVALKLSIGIIHKTEKRFFQPRSGPVHRTLLTSNSLSLSHSISLVPSLPVSLCCTVQAILWSATYLPDDLDFAALTWLGVCCTWDPTRLLVCVLCRYVSTPNVNRIKRQ